MKDEDIIKVVQARIDGEEIEEALIGLCSTGWRKKTSGWHFEGWLYRVKPKTINIDIDELTKDLVNVIEKAIRDLQATSFLDL